MYVPQQLREMADKIERNLYEVHEGDLSFKEAWEQLVILFPGSVALQFECNNYVGCEWSLYIADEQKHIKRFTLADLLEAAKRHRFPEPTPAPEESLAEASKVLTPATKAPF